MRSVKTQIPIPRFQPVSELAYLVIREGAKWSDVFRLVPGQAVTIGRAPTNQIVIKDERCSRNHVEVFLSAGQWTLRDLDSRNGTMVGNQRIKGDWLLHAGRHDPHRPLAIGLRPPPGRGLFRLRRHAASAGRAAGRRRRATAAARERRLAACWRPVEPDDDHPPPRADAVPRAGRGGGGASGMSKIGRAAAKLCRLAFELAKAPDVGQHGRAGPGRPGRGDADRRRGGAALPRDYQGEPRGRGPGGASPRGAPRHTTTSGSRTSWPPP